jgi:hypothetical protein
MPRTAASTTVHSASTAISEATNLVCPFVADVDSESTLNLTSETVASVTINNIDASFTAASAHLAEAFDCSGWGINRTDGQYQTLVGGLKVDLSGSLLKGILSKALLEATAEIQLEGEVAPASHGVNAFLESEMRTAFKLAFPDYVSLYEVSGNDATFASQVNLTGDSGEKLSTAAAAGARTSGAVDGGNALATASVFTQTSVVNSFGVSVDVSGDEAAQAMVTGLGSNTNYLQSLFMQLPIQNLRNYVDASGNKNDSDLPLAEGDSITFVWDITVNASTNPNTSNGIATGTQLPATGAGTQAPAASGQAVNQGPISMDLGTRRIAVVIAQAAAKAGETLATGDNKVGSDPYIAAASN